MTRTKYYLFSLLFAFLNFLIFWYLKYNLNSIGFNEFSLFLMGNMINFLILAAFIIEITAVFLLNRRNINSSILKISFSLSLSALTILLITYAINKIELLPGETRIFQISLLKLVNAGLLFTNQFLFVYAVGIIWKRIFSSSLIIYLRALNIAVIFFILLFIMAFITTFKSFEHEKFSSKYDIAVVLGAAVWSNNLPSPIFAARISKAFDLYKSKKVSKIQLTGGKAPGELTEAEAGKIYLQNLGMKTNSKNVLIENKTTTTSEQIKYIRENLYKYKKIAVISDRFHLARIREMSKFFNIKVKDIPSGYQLSWEKLLYFRLRETLALLIFWMLGI